MKTLASLFLGLTLASAQAPDRETGWQLLDAGFEAPQLAALPILGWYSDDLASGRVVSRADTENKLGGESSLSVTLVEERPEGRGRASVAQTVRRKAERAAHELDLSLGLKSRGLSEVLVEVYVWDEENVAQRIAKKPIRLDDPGWRRHALPITVPAGHDQFGIFVYLPNEQGGQLWLDEASLSAR